MASEAIAGNALGWVQLQLLGGWRRVMGIAAVYAVAVLLLMILIHRIMNVSDPAGVNLSSFAGTMLSILMFVEAAIIFFVGVGAIKKAVQRDFTSDMITSHRLTALSGHAAVFGYLTGATAQATALTVVNWIITTILAILAGQSAAGPTVLLAVLVCLVAMWWTFSVVLALATRGSSALTGVLVGLIVLLGISGGGLVSVVPGMALLLNVTAMTRFRVATTGSVSDLSIGVAMAAQLAYALIFFLAAARRFTRDDVPAFNTLLGQVLLALSALIAAVALRFWPDPVQVFGPGELSLQFLSIATLIAVMLVALVPVAAAARASARSATRRMKDPQFGGPPARNLLESPLLSTLIILGILAAVLSPVLPDLLDPLAEPRVAIAYVAAALILALVTVAGLLRFTYSVMDKATWILAVFVFLFWVVPPLGDLSLAVVADRHPSEPVSVLFGCSPIGTWIIAIEHMPTPILPGLVVQAVVAAIALVLAGRRARPTARPAAIVGPRP